MKTIQVGIGRRMDVDIYIHTHIYIYGYLAVEAVFLQDLVLVLDDLIPHRQL
jgi:hypothetical protein